MIYEYSNTEKCMQQSHPQPHSNPSWNDQKFQEDPFYLLKNSYKSLLDHARQLSQFLNEPLCYDSSPQKAFGTYARKLGIEKNTMNCIECKILRFAQDLIDGKMIKSIQSNLKRYTLLHQKNC